MYNPVRFRAKLFTVVKRCRGTPCAGLSIESKFDRYGSTVIAFEYLRLLGKNQCAVPCLSCFGTGNRFPKRKTLRPFFVHCSDFLESLFSKVFVFFKINCVDICWGCRRLDGAGTQQRGGSQASNCIDGIRGVAPHEARRRPILQRRCPLIGRFENRPDRFPNLGTITAA